MPKTLKCTTGEAHTCLRTPPFQQRRKTICGLFSFSSFSSNIPWHQLSIPSQYHLIVVDAHALHVTPMKGWLRNKPRVCPRLSFPSDTHSTSLRPNATRNERDSGQRHSKKTQQNKISSSLTRWPLNVSFLIATSNPDTVLIYCRAGTRPVIDLDLFYAPVRPHAKTERSQKAPQPFFFLLLSLFPRDKLKTPEEASVSIVGGSRQGTLQQLV